MKITLLGVVAIIAVIVALRVIARQSAPSGSTVQMPPQSV